MQHQGMIEEAGILTDWQETDLGKIEDAGNLVRGGRIDRYWSGEGLNLNPRKYVGTKEIVKAEWLHNSEKAVEHFGLRSIEFGNWMSQEDRANFLYGAMLSLHHLALLFKVKDNRIGFGGKLSISLGARGQGGAAGHYEPNPYSVINITKTMGIGVLAHEWAHALDNILSYHTNTHQTYVSGGRTTRKGFDETIAKKGNFFEKQFEEFFNILYYDAEGNKTDFLKALNNYDDYWNRRNEVFARTFEVYISDKLKKHGFTNHFLVLGASGEAYPSLELVGKVSRLIGNIVSKGFQVMKSGSKGLKGITGEPELTGYIGFRKTLKTNASLDDTLRHMKRIALRDTCQVADLSEQLQGATVAETSENIWNFLRENTVYKLDNESFEELRTPARSWHDRLEGIDCDDYTIFISALLLNLGIDHEYRIASYTKKAKFQHIYPVAFDQSGNSYVIDIVPEIPHFNFEEKPIIDLKTVSMELQELSGLGEVTDSNLEQELQADLVEELNQPFNLSGIEDEEGDEILYSSFLSGLGEVDTEEEADMVLLGSEVQDLIQNGLLAEINKARQTLEKEMSNPSALSKVVNVSKELDIINGIMEVWEDQDEAEEALEDAINQNTSYTNFYKALLMSLEKLDEEDSLSGLDDEPIFLAQIDMSKYEDEEIEGLGRTRLGRFFSKIGSGIKKVVKAVVRYNPATIAMRAAILIVLKVNLFRFASKLIYGYLTEQQARAKGVDLNEWRKIVSARSKAEKFFTKLGGKSKNFRNAIIKGRARRKTGLNLSGLGEVATATTAAATASPFILFMKKLLNKINPVRIIKSISSKIKTKRAGKAGGGEEIDPSQAMDLMDFGGDAGLMPESEADPFSEEAGEEQAQNNGSQGKQGIKEKVMSIWINHKKKVVIGGFSVIALIVFVVWDKMKTKRKHQLRGIKAARTRARNRKGQKQIRGVKRKPKRKSLGRGSTTTIRIPTKKTRVSKRSNKTRLKLMHQKAQQLKKKHPKAKYSTLLSKAAKLI